MTVKIYYIDPYLTEFRATVKKQFNEGNRWIVRLDQTCFYPEGGGQPADRGWLNGIVVDDVQEKNGNVYHYINRRIEQQEVDGKLDFPRRYQFMQQHTGQHLISSAFMSKGDYPTISVHLGDDYTSVEIDNSEILENVLTAVEAQVNEYIQANLAVSSYWVDRENLKKVPLRRPTKREKDIRVVEINGIDYSACGGTHVSRTGEVGLVKYVAIEKIRGRLRVLWKMGQRAITDYAIKSKTLTDLSKQFTSDIEEIPAAVFSLKQKLTDQISETKKYQTELVKLKAEKLFQDAEQPSKVKYVNYKFENQDNNYLKFLMEELLSKGHCVVLLTNEVKQKANWYAGVSEDLSIDLGNILPRILKIAGGKGGGRTKFWQGAVPNTTNIEDFLKYFIESIESSLSHDQ